jgi:hypothetical protein
LIVINKNLPRIFVLYLFFNRDPLDPGLRIINSICKDLYPEHQIINIFIENSCDKNHIKKEGGNYIISGDNTLFEISGWDKGFIFIKNNFSLNENDLIFYANDTFHKRSYSDGGSDYLNFFSKNYIENPYSSNTAIGYLDDFPKSVSLMGVKYSTWIRSNIFILSNDLSKKLHPFVFPLPKEYIFGLEGESFFRKVEEISINWQSYISNWLFGLEDPSYPEYRLRWLNWAPLTENNRLFFQTKALAILSEHYLSARLHKMKIEITDTNLFPKRANRHVTPYYRY